MTGRVELDRVESEMLFKFSPDPSPRYITGLIDPNLIFDQINDGKPINQELIDQEKSIISSRGRK